MQPPQLSSGHWWTLTLRRRRVFLASKEVSRLPLKVITLKAISKSLLQSFRLKIGSCQGCIWEAVGDPALDYSSWPLSPQAQQGRCHYFVHGKWVGLASGSVGLSSASTWWLPYCWGQNPQRGPRSWAMAGVNASWWHTRNESHAQLVVCARHSRHPPEDTVVPLLRKTHSGLRPGGIQTNFLHAAAVTVREGTFPKLTCICCEHMAHVLLIMFRAAEAWCF